MSGTEMMRLLAEHEEAIEMLYRQYAGRFGGYSDFWRRIADEEKKHSRILRHLRLMADEEMLYHNPSGFNMLLLRDSITSVKAGITKVRSGLETIDGALAFARELETNIVELKFFDAFKDVTAEYRSAFNDIKNDTSRHALEVQNEWWRITVENPGMD